MAGSHLGPPPTSRGFLVQKLGSGRKRRVYCHLILGERGFFWTFIANSGLRRLLGGHRRTLSMSMVSQQSFARSGALEEEC